MGWNKSPFAQDVMDYITLASTGNAQDFGNLIKLIRNPQNACANSVRGIYCRWSCCS